MDRLVRTENILKAPMLTLLVLIGLLPLWLPAMHIIEKSMLPVVSKFKVLDWEYDPVKNGVYFTGAFEKYRECRWLYNHVVKDGVRLSIQFEPRDVNLPISRPVGPQSVGPWFITGVTSLEGVKMVSVHSCHPLYNTHTIMIP